MAELPNRLTINFDLTSLEGRHAYRLYRLLEAFDGKVQGISAFVALTSAPNHLRELGRSIGYNILDLEDQLFPDVRHDPDAPVLLRGRDGDLRLKLIDTFGFVIERIMKEQTGEAEEISNKRHPAFYKSSVKIKDRPPWMPDDDDF